MTEAQELERRIRDLVNEPRKKAILMKDHPTWGKVCSALDVLGDTELAMEAFLAGPDAGREREHATGNLYIVMYGILQVLYVQQDATRTLSQTIRGFPYQWSDDERYVREVRNAAVGHPTHQQYANPHAFNFVSRISMRGDGFQLLRYRADGTQSMERVNVPGLIERQRRGASAALRQILKALKEDEMEHRKRFRDQKLEALFPATLDYTHEKVSEAISNGDREFGASMLTHVANCVTEFKASIAARGIERTGFLEYELPELEHALARLAGHFSNPGAGVLATDARVYHFFIKAKVNKLRNLARQIDDDYAEELPDDAGQADE